MKKIVLIFSMMVVISTLLVGCTSKSKKYSNDLYKLNEVTEIGSKIDISYKKTIKVM